MSGLRERLLRHKKPAAGEGSGPAAAEAAGAGSAAAERGEDNAAAAGQEWAQIGAHMEQSERGAFVMRRRVYDVAAFHGRYALHELIGRSDQLRALLAPAGAAAKRAAADGRGIGGDGSGTLPHEQLLYLDTETTGLGIGAGNVPFMIGIGFYEGRRFVVEQMFIRHPGEELAMLHYLQQKLEKHPYLVSYNGKTFDWPVIRNRYILNRMPCEPEIAGHLDFLYPSRSLWKHILPSCRLGKVEEERLHVARLNDVPGSLAPALYFQYLAERDVTVVEGVFEHNELDILSLAGLSIHFAGVLDGKSDMEEMENEELYRLGLWLDKAGRNRLADKALGLLTERICDPEAGEGTDYMLPLAQLYKQQHRFPEACRLWTLYIKRKGDQSTSAAEPYIELSMHYEHREKLYDRALYYAEQALHKACQRKLLKRSYGIGAVRTGAGRSAARSEDKKLQEETAALEKRIGRLRRKSGLVTPTKSSKRQDGGKTKSSASIRKSGIRDTGYVMDYLI